MHIHTARIVRRAGSMKRSSVRPSVCLSRHSTSAAACGGFAAERRAGKRCRSTAANACDGRRLVYYTDRPPLSTSRFRVAWVHLRQLMPVRITGLQHDINILCRVGGKLHHEAAKRNHFSFMNKSFDTQCNLTKFSTLVVNEYYHRCCLFNFWIFHQYPHLSVQKVWNYVINHGVYRRR